MIGDSLDDDADKVQQRPIQDVCPQAMPSVDEDKAQQHGDDAPQQTMLRSTESKIYMPVKRTDNTMC